MTILVIRRMTLGWARVFCDLKCERNDVILLMYKCVMGVTGHVTSVTAPVMRITPLL